MKVQTTTGNGDGMVAITIEAEDTLERQLLTVFASQARGCPMCGLQHGQRAALVLDFSGWKLQLVPKEMYERRVQEAAKEPTS